MDGSGSTTRPGGKRGPDAKGAKRPGKAPSLTEQVYQRLKSDILSCRLEPGQEISEAELAERFEVSKTPVREALAALRQEHLVQTFPRRGYQIAPITFGDMNELFDLRTILEAGAGELACEQITEDELAQLRELAVVAYEKDEVPTIEAFIAANRDFHLAIARASRNERLYGVLNRQIAELERFFYLGAQLRDVNNETNADHVEIVDALAARDRAKVRELMIRHNDVTRQGLFQALATSRQFGSIRL
ncbi:GntR family transcriptional regulator [Poseidonocella sp. HB161398]|uniref:GntR family transcriptional regulator n=1 Tax=Poseidonocella sp. HB161398 TaxID=2320855 RepID=UPI001108C07E|nr:GntR family transcriptional regulator [Poseidonocella sp. HB161398]